MASPVGEQFVRAIAAKDDATLRGLLAPNVDFRALTPNQFWQAGTAAEVIDDVILGEWFEPTDHIDAIENIEHDTVGERERYGYRFRVKNDDGTFAVDQQLYMTVENDTIVWLRVMCAGFMPVE